MAGSIPCGGLVMWNPERMFIVLQHGYYRTGNTTAPHSVHAEHQLQHLYCAAWASRLAEHKNGFRKSTVHTRNKKAPEQLNLPFKGASTPNICEQADYIISDRKRLNSARNSFTTFSKLCTSSSVFSCSPIRNLSTLPA